MCFATALLRRMPRSQRFTVSEDAPQSSDGAGERWMAWGKREGSRKSQNRWVFGAARKRATHMRRRDERRIRRELKPGVYPAAQ